MKMYDLGLVIGRFQMLHNGHMFMIQNALNLCNRVVVYVGSAQEQGTETNPFSYEVRAGMLELAFPVEVTTGRLIIRPLYDAKLGNNDRWGKYVLSTFEKEFYKQPDLYVTGVEKERPSWFLEADAPKMCELRLSRSTMPCTATECREALSSNDEDGWRSRVPYQLYQKYDFYRETLMNVLAKSKVEEK